MTQLSSIPIELVNTGRRADFVRWLVNMPFELSSKRGIIKAWSTKSNNRLTAEQYKQIINSAQK